MNRLICITILSVPLVLLAEQKNKFEIQGDNPNRFNWTNPDLFRWELNVNAELGRNFIDDKENIILKKKNWLCKVTKTKRDTWIFQDKRLFMESRKIICSSGGFISQMETSCRLGKREGKTVFIDANSVFMEVGLEKKLNSISLQCGTWYDKNHNNKNDSFEWRWNVNDWESKE